MNTMLVTDLAKLPVHPFADKFPFISDEESADLARDIEENGLVHPIVLHEGTLLDGRNRLRAAGVIAEYDRGMILPVEVYEGADPVGYIISVNLQRRHLTTGQRALLAVELLPYLEEQARERMLAGVEDPSENSHQGRSTALAGEKLGVSEHSVTQARKLSLSTSYDAPEAIEKVRSGAWSLNEGVQHVAPRKDDRILIQRETDRPGGGRQIEYVKVAAEAGLLDLLEKALGLLADAKQLAPKFAQSAPDEDVVTAGKIARKIAGLVDGLVEAL